VRRYGPAVFGVCRRALGDHHLAEDAFQAVFAVLARKADTIRPPGAVGGWLYGVARKAAVEAVAMRRRKAREALPGDLPDTPTIPAEFDDTAAAVDAEIANLPPSLRAAVVLCEIEGVSRADAARRLGIAEGTLSSRLAAARKRLAERLRTRGVAPVAGLAVALPEALARAAVRRADGDATGTVLELSRGGLRTTLIANLKPPLLLCAAVVAVVLAAGTDTCSPVASASPRRTQPPAPEKPVEWKEVFTLKHTHPVTAVAANAKMVVVGLMKDGPQKGGICLWDGQTGKELDLDYRREWNLAPPRYLRFTTQEGFFAAGIEGAAIHYRARPGGYATDTISSTDMLACSPDLNTVLARHTDGWKNYQPNQLYLYVNPWGVKDRILNHIIKFEEECNAITHADVSADDRRVAIAGDDAKVRVYHRGDLRHLRTLELPKGTVTRAVRYSPDGGRLAVVGEGGFVKLFDDAGKEGAELKGHAGSVTAVAFSPDGKRVVTTCGKVARVFDAATGKPVGVIEGHADEVTAVAFSSDGKRVVTGSADKTAKVWEPK
jgi:RNA polymerase sigma factor (sigma-70 family)